MTLQKWPEPYYKTLNPKTFNDVFISITPTMFSFKRELGLMKTQALLTIILNDLIRSINVGQTMSVEQVADCVNDIIDQYGWLNVSDFRLCFNNAKNGVYDKGIFRLDSSVILSWLYKYSNDRLNAADESSYNAHLANSFETNIPELEKYYKKSFRK